MKHRNNKESIKGQSTLEFVLASLLGMTLFFFFIKMALVFSYSTYVQYATFMASRAYLSAGRDRLDQVDRARSVILTTLKLNDNPNTDRFQFIARPVQTGSDVLGATIGAGNLAQAGGETDVNSSWQLGVRYDIEFRMFFGGFASSKNQILSSESWLGRETTYDECNQFMSARGWVFDNGC
jgi:hypothetical protein